MAIRPPADIDIVMLGTFSAWRLGAIQARALPFACGLSQQGLRTAIVTTPWDRPEDAGTIDVIDGVPLINTSQVRPLRAPAAVAEQLAWVRRLKPRAIHLIKPKGAGGLTARALMSVRRTLPVVVDYDDWEGDGGWNDVAGYSLAQRTLFNWQERDLIVKADHIVAANTLLAVRARHIRGERGRVSYIPNGLESGWRETLAGGRNTPPGSTSPPTVLLYSRFAEFPDDWVPRFVAALAERSATPTCFVVVGNQPGQIDNIEIPPSIVFDPLGYVARERLPEILGAADVAVFPYQDSLIARTKQSVKLLELMAAGCPVVASSVGDVPRTLGSAGVVLPTAEPEHFAETVVQLFACPDRLATLSLAGQDRARDNFSVERFAGELADIYRRLEIR